MHKLVLVILGLSIISCKNKTDSSGPTTFPFGYKLAEFEETSVNNYGAGDCWGTMREFTKGEFKIVSDSTQCSEYSLSNSHFLLKNDSIRLVHSLIFETAFNEETQKPYYLASEYVYDFSAQPPSFHQRLDTLDFPTSDLFKASFEKIAMENVDANYVEFSNRLTELKSMTNQREGPWFSITYGAEKIDPKTQVPSTDVYLNSSVSPEPQLLVQEYNVYELHKPEQRAEFGVPEDAQFAFYSWFAGGGACYYGVLQNKVLKVYRKYLEEVEPEEGELKFELFKEFSSDGSSIGQTHYICYTGDNNQGLEIMITFVDGKAKSVKYKGQSESIQLEFEKEEFEKGGAYPTLIDHYKEIIAGKETGKYKLTHSGNWDYVEYKRAKDGKLFNFTINHEISIRDKGYTTSSCF